MIFFITYTSFFLNYIFSERDGIRFPIGQGRHLPSQSESLSLDSLKHRGGSKASIGKKGGLR